MLKLVPPGERKNKFWAVRGTLDGHKIERSLGVGLRSDAEKKLKDLYREYEAGKNINTNVTFEQAAERYIESRDLGRSDELVIAKLVKHIGSKFVADIRQHDLVLTTTELCPEAAPATKNRSVITPMAAILHYAAENEWCTYRKFKKFKPPAAKPRYVTPETEAKLLGAVDGYKYLILRWLFLQGDRIGDVLRIRYEDCDLEKGIVSRHISKSDRYVELPLDWEICKLLKATGKTTGRVFPWTHYTGVRRWLEPLREKLGVEFTPHMARHTLGKRLNDAGAGLKTIMQTLGHSNAASSIRYQTTDLETIRQAKDKAHERCKPVPTTDEGRAA